MSLSLYTHNIIIKAIKRFGHRSKKLVDAAFSERLVERASDPYVTHIPILVGISKLYEIRTVLEIGSGENSTLTFLNPIAFPDLASLITLENDYEWKNRVEKLIKHDPRVQLQYISGCMSDAVSRIDINGYDMVFIDDSVSADLRAATIREVAKKLSQRQFMLIHDYECKEYRRAVHGLMYTFRFDSLNPNTGLAGNQSAIERSQLKQLNKLVKKYRADIKLSDIYSWSTLFDAHL